MTAYEIKNKIKALPQVKEWIATYTANSQHTQKRYLKDLTNFCIACDFDDFDKLANTKSTDIETFYKWAKEKNWKNTGINMVTQTLKIFFNYLLLDLDVKNKTILSLKKLPNDSEPQRCPTEKEISQILETIPKHTSKKKMYAIFLLYFKSGLRFSELTNLKLSDIKSNSVRVVGKGSKIREQLVPEDVMTVVNDYIKNERPSLAIEFERRYKEGTPYVFLADFNGKIKSKKENYQRISNPSLNNSLKRFAKLAKIKDYDRLHIHSCRHAYATMVYKKACGDIRVTQQLMRHANIQQTQRYIEVSDEQMENVINKL